jgi:hypothetical protein
MDCSQRGFVAALANRRKQMRENRWGSSAVDHAAMMADGRNGRNLEDVDHVLAIVLGISDQALPDRIDDEI